MPEATGRDREARTELASTAEGLTAVWRDRDSLREVSAAHDGRSATEDDGVDPGTAKCADRATHLGLRWVHAQTKKSGN